MKGNLFFLSMLFCASAQALTFNEALDAAVANDKKYAAAIYEYQAAEYLPTIARAGLLPKVNFSTYKASNKLTQTQADFFGNPSTSNQNYTATARSVQLQQPLINLAALAAYLGAQSDVEAASYKLKTSYADLVLELSNSYSNYLAYSRVVNLTLDELSLLEKQQTIMEKRQALGASSIADIEEVKYSKYQAQSTLETAKANLEMSKAPLERLIGRKLTTKDELAFVDYSKQLPASLQAATEIALISNPAILRVQKTADSASLANRKAQADYLPTLDLVAANGYQNSNTLSTVGQTSQQSYFGLQLTVPIFSGGETYGKERQSAMLALSERTKVEAQIDEVKEDLAKNYQLLTSTKLKRDALNSQIASANFLVDAASKGYELGAKSLYDKLLAIRKSFDAKRDLQMTNAQQMQAQVKIDANTGFSK